MPHKAFLKKKSLLDRFKDDYGGHTGYIQSARAEHTWSNPLTRRKRTNKLNGWIKSFAGKRHVHKLARFNAQQAGRNESYEDVKLDCLRYADILELPNGVCVKVNATIRCPRRAAFVFRITGIYDAEPENPSKYVIRGFYPVYGLERKPSEEFDIPCNDVSDIEQWVKSNEKGTRMQNEAMSLKGFIENLTEKLTKQFDLDEDEVKNYLDSHTEEMQILLDNKDMSLKEKVLFVRSEITGEKDEAKKSERLFNKREMERIALSEGSKVSPYLVEIAHKILKDEYGWKASTLEDVADWLGDHKQAFEHAYGQALRNSDDDKANVKAGIEAALDEEEQGVMNAEIAMMGESKKHEGYGGTKSVMSIWGNRPRDVYPEVSYSSVNDMYNTLLKYGYGEMHPIYYKNNSPEQIKGHILGYFRWTPTNSDADIEADALAAATMIKNNFNKSESKEPAEEKLGYEKGHKNSKGEDAPWVIRSHKDNRVLASFPTKKEAEDQMQRMKQYSKNESAATEEDAIRKAFKSIVEHVPANAKSNFDEEFVNENMEALLDLFNGWFEFDDGEFVTTVRVVDPDNENGDCYDEEDEAYQWNACYNVTEGIIDLLGWNYGEETVKQPIQDALFYDFIGTKYIDKSNESKMKKTEKKSEGFSLELIDTIKVPQWLWNAYNFNDTTDLEDDEIKKLDAFKEEYKFNHLDDRGEEAYFSSHNDFDSLGGNVYDVDVYKRSDMPTEKKNESIKDFPTNTGYKFTFGFQNPKTANVAMNVAKEKGYACEQGRGTGFDDYNNVSIWVKEPQDAIRFADAIVNVANGENGVSLERSDVDKAFALAVKNNAGYKENKDAIDTAASQYALSIRPTESFDGLFILGELTDVVDFLEEIK